MSASSGSIFLSGAPKCNNSKLLILKTEYTASACYIEQKWYKEILICKFFNVKKELCNWIYCISVGMFVQFILLFVSLYSLLYYCISYYVTDM